MTADLRVKEYENIAVLYMAMELSNKTWRLALSDGTHKRQVSVDAGDTAKLTSQLDKAKQRWNLPAEVAVVSCYEAGRDGFWIHRRLLEDGIENQVIDSSSIEVNRRSRRAKTDRVDVKGLLRLLIRYGQGERAVMSVVRVPTVAEEDDRRLHRERERLLKERGSHSARIKSLLVAHGLRLEIRSDFLAQLASASSGGGYALGVDLKAELRREYERYRLVHDQVKALEAEQ